jgi:hypothetical protein
LSQSECAQYVAEELHRARVPGQDWSEVEQSQQEEARLLAQAAIDAHLTWLQQNGRIIVKFSRD